MAGELELSMPRTPITPALLSLGLSEFELRLSGDHEPEAPEPVACNNEIDFA